MNIGEQVDTLQSEIDLHRKQIRSDSYSTSVGEWISLYEQKDIEIYTEFQKAFLSKNCFYRVYPSGYTNSINIRIST
jgi:hypothetical protein